MSDHDRRGPVVVGVDGSAAAVQAVRWAARAARLHGVPVRLVHAYDLLSDYQTVVVDNYAVLANMRERGRRWLRDATKVLAEAASELSPEIGLHAAPVVQSLIDESEHASMVVLGTRGLGPFTGVMVGSTAVALAGYAHCPVVVVRGLHDDIPPGDPPVVVGVDGTPISEDAIGFAFAEASLRGCSLIAVHTWVDSLLEAALAGDREPLDFEPLQQQAYELMAERLAGWSEKYPDVRVSREVVRDRPTRALLRYAQTAQLLVVGSRGRGGFSGLVLGSTSQDVMRHAPCPVAVVRPHIPH